jgi:hypothetical protein
MKLRMNKINKKIGQEMELFLEVIHVQLSPFYLSLGAMIVFICLDFHSAFAGDNLTDFTSGVRAEAGDVSRNAVGTAATVGFGLMSLGAGNLGRTVAMTGIGGSVGYMVWPMIERKMMAISGGR